MTARVASRELARLPDALCRAGPPTRWAEMTRPGGDLRSFLEAPVWDGADLVLCDMAAGRVLRLAPSGAWSVEHDYDGAPHAMRIAGGRRVVADYWHGLIEMTGPAEWRPLPAPEREFLGLSDMALAPDGALWITDPGRSSLADPRGALWRLGPEFDLRLAARGIAYPNGVALSPDGALAYVAATCANAVLRLHRPARATPADAGRVPQPLGQARAGRACDRPGGPPGRGAGAGGGRAGVRRAGRPGGDGALARGEWTTAMTFDPADPARLLVVETRRAALWEARLPEEDA